LPRKTFDAASDPEEAESLTKELRELEEQQRQSGQRNEQIRSALAPKEAKRLPADTPQGALEQTDDRWLKEVAADMRRQPES
jgi:FKBP-type peptidyl-prolyl cis-trans isomerase (trigger factor)